MSIRLRLAVVFAVASAVLFAAGSWVFVTELSSALLRSIDAQLSARLEGAGRYLPAGDPPPDEGSSADSATRPASATAARAPSPSPAGAGTPAPTLSPSFAGTPAPGEYVVQVVDPSGHVRGGSADAGQAPLLGPAELRRARTHSIVLFGNDEGERERVMAGPLRPDLEHPGWVAVVAVSLESFDATIRDVTRGLVIAGVVLVAAAGFGAYGLARAALSPVERLRREVAALSERDQARGVRVPATRDEIAALATTMNDLLGRLQRALARQRALVADASHELRTPFAILRGELELAARPGRSREELAEAVEHASEEAARLARITDQLLFLAHRDEEMMPPRLTAARVRPLLDRSAEHLASRAAAASVTCDVQAPDDLVAQVDPDLVREAVDNLADNALRFAPAGTAVCLTARAAGADLVIEVSDRGPGFPAEFLPRAFERFARPESGRTRAGGGAGLGLAIVAAIARAHGGTAQARNQAPQGAVVTLTFPGAVDPSGT